MFFQHTIPEQIRRFSQTGLDAVFPVRCWQCKEMYFRAPLETVTIDNGKRFSFDGYAQLMADYLCSDCCKLFKPIESPLCSRCGRPFETRHGVDHECSDCHCHPFSFEIARASAVFDKPLKVLIHQYKYNGRTELAFILGGLLLDTFYRFYDSKAFDLVLPVPLHWFKQYRRGFNQVSLLLRQWEKNYRKKNLRLNFPICSEKVLVRHRHTFSQTGLRKRRRIANLKNVFTVADRKRVDGKRVLLVDDVLTTGATADACTKVLRKAGAASVSVLTLARTI